MKTTVPERPLPARRAPPEPLSARTPEDRIVPPQTASSAGALPPDLLREAMERLGWFATIASVAMGMALVVPTIFPSLTIGTPQVRVPLLGALMAVSLALAWAARSGRLPARRALDVALTYQVTACAALALVVNSRDWPADPGLPGWSPVLVIVLAAPLVIPSTTPRTLVTAVLSAAMDPLAVLVLVRLGTIEMPSAEALLVRFYPTPIAILLAVFASRVVHRLGEKLTRAREMGSYKLIEKLGVGGMGEVWRAGHLMLARDAAVKLIRPEILGGGDDEAGRATMQRFLREARAIAALRSPNTIHLYDCGVASDGTLYYVMELLDGVDLETLVREHGPQPPERVVHLLVQICRSLREAHEAGLVHRDVKPANVFLCRRYGGEADVAKVLDFGLVTTSRRDQGDPSSLGVTADDVITGTPAYLSPEMATGARPVEARSDLYAVGCVAYYLLTGELVFEAKGAIQIAAMHASMRPKRPSARTDRPIPAALEAIVMECLEKDPDDRPPSARVLEARLAALAIERTWTEESARAWWEARARGALGSDDPHSDGGSALEARA